METIGEGPELRDECVMPNGLSRKSRYTSRPMATYEPFDWYEQPLYYDIIFDSDTDLESQFLEDVHAKHCTSGGVGGVGGVAMLEPACGSGRLVASMSKRGFDVTGFDLRDEMVQFAERRLRQRRIKATVFEADMTEFRTRRKFDIAHCLVSTFKHLLEESAARAHLKCVARSLKKGGVYVLGAHLSDYECNQRSRERWVADRGGTHVVCNIQSQPPMSVTRTEEIRARLIATTGKGKKRYESHWTFRTYDLAEMQALIRSVPAFEHIETYDFTHEIDCPITFDGEQLDTVMVLRKK